MLVLTRKTSEGVVIGGKIVIRVLGVQKGRVRLGVEAPAEVVVLREEIADRLALHGPDRNGTGRTTLEGVMADGG